MGQRDIIALLASLFDKYEVSYILTGSFAGAYWGHPRATHDIDFVVEVKQLKVTNLISVLKNLGDEFEVDFVAVKNAVKDRRQFNVIHRGSELKIDFWLAKNTRLGKSEFRRKVLVNVFGEKVAIASAEDLILTKLSWVKEVYSDRHFRDCVGIFERQKGKLDEKYLAENAKKLGVTKLLSEARKGKYY